MGRWAKRTALRPRLWHGILMLTALCAAATHTAAAEAPPACTPVVARIVSIEGSVEIRRSGQTSWSPVRRLDTPMCGGDLLHAGARSRAALVILPEKFVRLDQNSTVSIGVSGDETIVEFFQDETTPKDACGAGYFITRFPRKFKVRTPFVNAAVEGTEFMVSMSCSATAVAVFEGKVSAETLLANAQRFILNSGETVTAGPGEPPAIKLLVKPVDAVQWALYYPPLSEPGVGAGPDQQCDQPAPDEKGRCLLVRAEHRLRVGRVDEAQADIETSLKLVPDNSDADALLSIISVVKNDKQRGLQLAQHATQLDPLNPRAWIALSYAQQANFNLEEALSSSQRASELQPQSSVALGRMAELLTALGKTRSAERAAQAAVAANPKDSRAHTVLGLVHLVQLDVRRAREDFEVAISLDSSDPLPRLGLGLAIIRSGDLTAGRAQIEIAVALDPTNSILRSYVGRAYYEERTKARSKLALQQFDLAHKLDPNDPTPLFYSAIVKQAYNRPIEGVADMQESLRLNDNRAIYRPRTALDQDAAARSVGLARLYTQLGFSEAGQEQVASALAEDPSSFAGQQYLSDIASYEPRQQATRASAGLQAQLRQPLSTDTPLVGLTSTNSLVPDRPYLSAASIGGQRPGFYDFDPMFFSRPGITARAGGLIGSFDTSSYGLSAAGNLENISLAGGGLHTETNGQRTNNDQSRDAYAVLLTAQPTRGLTLQADYQYSDASFGDLPIRWDPNFILANVRNSERLSTSRIGARGQVSPDAEVLLAFTYAESTGTVITNDPIVPFSIQSNRRSTASEAQYVQNIGRLNLVAGLSFIEGTLNTLFDFPTFFFTSTQNSSERDQTAYLYATFTPFDERLKLTVGAAWDHAQLDEIVLDEEAVYPKLGVLWKPTESTSVRVAYFEMMQRPLPAAQTLEPVQVAGFFQMYDDPIGTKSKQLAGAIDQKLGRRVFLGLNGAERELDTTFRGSTPSGFIGVTTRWTESRIGGYIGWLPSDSIALSLQVIWEDFERNLQNQGTGAFLSLKQVRAPATIQWFSPSGLSASFRTTYLRQYGTFCTITACDLPGNEGTPIADFGLNYRLPWRAGFVSLDVLNIFDRKFQYQSVDTSTLVPFTGRAVFARVLLVL